MLLWPTSRTPKIRATLRSNRTSRTDERHQQQQAATQRQPGQNQDAERQRQQSQGNPDKDRNMVGKDTDGDGKVGEAGPDPGQSHGTGMKPDQKR